MARPRLKEKSSLRNFMLPDNVYYALEFIAEKEGKDVTAVLIDLSENKIEVFKEEQKLDKVPMTYKRKNKLKKKKEKELQL